MNKLFKIISLLISIAFFTTSFASIQTSAKQAILIDADTGQVLFSKRSKSKMTPSSMSKLMTIYIVFERLKDQDISLNDKFIISKKAWAKQGSKMFLEPGQKVRVIDLIRGVIVQSGNDAAIALAEGLAGSEEAFVLQMNSKAKELGLSNSTFKNSTGWPDPGHVMSPKDLATLSLRLVNDFPEYYHYFGERDFKFNGIKQKNRNPLISSNLNVDGLKTGHSSKGGYGIAVTAMKKGRRLVLVVNGLPTEKSRATEAYKLLQYGFLNFTNIKIANKGKVLVKDIPTWMSTPDKVDLIAKENLEVTVPVSQKKLFKTYVEYKSPLNSNNQNKPGRLVIELPQEKIVAYNLATSQNIKPSGFLGSVYKKLTHYLKSFSSDAPQETTNRIDIQL